MRMGQHASAPTGVGRGRRKSFRESWRSPFPRRSRTHQGSLSAAFNFTDVDLKVKRFDTLPSTVRLTVGYFRVYSIIIIIIIIDNNHDTSNAVHVEQDCVKRVGWVQCRTFLGLIW